jgi:ribosome maturation factor RimP
MVKLNDSLEDKIGALIAALGFEFVGLEYGQQNRLTVVRIFMDSPEGIKIDDCSRVSRQVGAMLDVEDPGSGQYVLEVSSPGLNRPLFTISQYQKQVGCRIKVRLHYPLDGRSNFVGQLKKVEAGQISLVLEDGQDVTLSHSEIEKANVIADIG